RVFAARLVASSHWAEGQPLDRILVKDLVLDFRIGVHAHEQLAPQKVRLNLEVQVRPRSGPLSDDIGDVLSYEDILNGIKELADGQHIHLVETLAERIAGICLADPRAVRARVRVEKLEIEPAAAGVGIEIERRR
ncbi:MAG: dihydroneopterin aldolase, partial [Kiloniellales bacterium]